MAKKVKSAEVAVQDDKWKTESDFRTLMDAHEIMGDKKRHAKAMDHGKNQKKKINSMASLKAYVQDKYGPKAEADEVE